MLLSGAVIFCPSKKISPEVGSSKRFKQRRMVLFPLPEGPMMTTTSPSLTVKSMAFKTSLSPKLFDS
jgi:hypothetical protein